MRLIALCLLLAACSSGRKAATPAADVRAAELLNMYIAHRAEAAALRDPDTGWLTADCDSMLTTGKYAAAHGVTGTNIALAEYVDEPGRFARRPLARPCWTPEQGDVGSKTTWSRDMGLGLLAYAWKARDKALVERHAAYGRAHPLAGSSIPAWKMGEPLDDGRVVYTPAFIGLTYEVLFALGGESFPERGWPNTYSAGLVDYQAHLQMLDIWLRGEITEKQLGLLDISDVMLARITEHATREPADPFYTYLEGLYSGDLSRATSNCLDPALVVGTYGHCRGERGCHLAHWLFACGLTLRRLGAL